MSYLAPHTLKYQIQLIAALTTLYLAWSTEAIAEDWPTLPDRNSAVNIPAQEWPLHPGPREVRVGIYYPDGTLASVGPRTGIFLSLHNWGGTDTEGTASPEHLAKEFNVVALSVRYLQSGKKASIDDPEPYDFGWLQGLDALRAMWLVFHELDRTGTPFARGRLFATGGSGGGNVSLMANKLAPRTFTCVVDMCGMKKLSDALAYNLPAAGKLNARWSRDPASPNYLSPGAQEIRFVGHPDHLAEMKRLGTSTKIFMVHGVDDKTCLEDGREMVANMQRAGININVVWITPEIVDGVIFKNTGHSMGNRTLVPGHVAGRWLLPDSPDALVRQTLTDFERQEEIRYATTDGAYVISYANGYPIGRFEPRPPAPSYKDHFDVLRVTREQGDSFEARTSEDWEPRRQHIRAAMERVMGPLPNPARRVALDVKVLDEVTLDGGIVRRHLSYQSDATDRVAAYLLMPPSASNAKRPAMLCLHQTSRDGKAEPVGVAGNPDLHYALELAQRGYVTLAPDYPGFGESNYDFSPEHGYASGSMKAMWDNIRAVDLLETLPEVDASRIGVIGHSLGGHNAMFTAAFEPRLKAIVSSCGFTTFRKDDLPSWTGKSYMPRIQSKFNNEASLLPFDFHEVITTFAPRPFLAIASQQDSDFDVSGVREVMTAAGKVYQLFEAEGNLKSRYPAVPHSFPDEERKAAYDWLDEVLK